MPVLVADLDAEVSGQAVRLPWRLERLAAHRPLAVEITDCERLDVNQVVVPRWEDPGRPHPLAQHVSVEGHDCAGEMGTAGDGLDGAQRVTLVLAELRLIVQLVLRVPFVEPADFQRHKVGVAEVQVAGLDQPVMLNVPAPGAGDYPDIPRAPVVPQRGRLGVNEADIGHVSSPRRRRWRAWRPAWARCCTGRGGGGRRWCGGWPSSSWHAERG